MALCDPIWENQAKCAKNFTKKSLFKVLQFQNAGLNFAFGYASDTPIKAKVRALYRGQQFEE